MTVENPTADNGGASISERLENFLAASENPQPQQASDAEPPKADNVEPESSPEVEAEADAGDESPDQDEPQISLSDVAKWLGVDESALDVDEDGGIKVKTKIDGREGAAKFSDLVKSYQLQGHVDAKAREAAEQARALQERVQQFEQYAQAEAQKLSQLAYVAHQELMRDAAGIDWNDLAQNDPAGYVAKQHEFQARQARVNQMVQVASQQRAQVEQVEQQGYYQALNRAAEVIAADVEGWKPGNEVDNALLEYATQNSIGDTQRILAHYPKFAQVLHKAMLYDKGQAKTAEIVEKKVRTAPKLVKPGQSQDARERAQQSVRNLRDNIRKSGGRSGIAEFLLATGKV